MVTRRDILKAGLATTLGTMLSLPPSGRTFASDGLVRFVDPLPVPPVLGPRRFKGLSYYEIGMREFQQMLHPDLPPTTLWGYNGHYPGPTLEAYEHERVSVRWLNDLRDAHGNYRSEL